MERGLVSRADERVLRWFGHVERMDEYRMDRRVLMAEVCAGRVRGRPRLVDGAGNRLIVCAYARVPLSIAGFQ